MSTSTVVFPLLVINRNTRVSVESIKRNKRKKEKKSEIKYRPMVFLLADPGYNLCAKIKGTVAEETIVLSFFHRNTAHHKA
jgi:hypothetical protein